MAELTSNEIFSAVIPAAAARRVVAIDAVPRHEAMRQRGRALEVLGHAIEYLVDSRLAQFEQEATVGDGDAVRLLIGASRAVFADSPAYASATSRLRRWLYEKVMAAAA